MLWQYLCDNNTAYSSRAEVCQHRTGAQGGVGSTGDLQVEILLRTDPELEPGFTSTLQLGKAVVVTRIQDGSATTL